MQDPDLLAMFFPYLPKDRRTHAGLSRAMTSETWRLRVLTGESQVTVCLMLNRLYLLAAYVLAFRSLPAPLLLPFNRHDAFAYMPTSSLRTMF